MSLLDMQGEELVTWFLGLFISQALLFKHSGELVSLWRSVSLDFRALLHWLFFIFLLYQSSVVKQHHLLWQLRIPTKDAFSVVPQKKVPELHNPKFALFKSAVSKLLGFSWPTAVLFTACLEDRRYNTCFTPNICTSNQNRRFNALDIFIFILGERAFFWSCPELLVC